MKTLTFFSALLFTFCSWGVSRVGGGKVRSQFSGFELSVPDYFVLSDADSSKVRGSGGPLILRNGTVTQEFFEISEVRSIFPMITSMSLENTKSFFHVWSVVSHKGCVLIFKLNGQNAFSYLATWGNGKGLVISSLESERLEKDLSSAIKEMIVQPEACAWK